MLAARLCSQALRGSLAKPGLFRLPTSGSLGVRLNSGDARGTFSRQAARRRTLKETAMAPSQGTAISLGQGALAGGAVVGLGALAFYGLGMSSDMGAVDKAVAWPQYVKDRVKDTYMYFGASLGATAASAVAIFRTPALINMVSRGGLMAMGVSIAAMIGSSMVARSIPYQQGLGAKQAAWLVHCAVVGAVIAPICLLGKFCYLYVKYFMYLRRAHPDQGGLVHRGDGGGPLHRGCVCSLRQVPLHGGPSCHGTGSGVLCQPRVCLPSSDHSSWSWAVLCGHVRRLASVRSVPLVRHPAHHPQG
jgi:hypothetical protein